MQSSTLIFVLTLILFCKASPLELKQAGDSTSAKLLERSPIAEKPLHFARATSQSAPHLDYEDHIFSIESKPDSPLSKTSPEGGPVDPSKLHLGKHARPKNKPIARAVNNEGENESPGTHISRRSEPQDGSSSQGFYNIATNSVTTNTETNSSP